MKLVNSTLRGLSYIMLFCTLNLLLVQLKVKATSHMYPEDFMMVLFVFIAGFFNRLSEED